MDEENVVLHSLVMISADEKMKIEKIGSGCLLVHRDLLFLLTVGHLKKTQKSKLTLILHNFPQLGFLPNWYIMNPTMLKSYILKFPAWFCKFVFKFFSITRLAKKIDPSSICIQETRSPDFVSSSVNIPFVPIKSLPIDSKYIGMPYRIFRMNELKKPEKNKNYSFYGLSQFDGKKQTCKENFFGDLEYIRSKGFYHIFSFSGDSSTLKGCSGAPIMGSDGELVSLVAQKDGIEKNLVYGVNLEKVKISLNMEANWIKGEEIYE